MRSLLLLAFLLSAALPPPALADDPGEQEALYLALCQPLRTGGDEEDSALNAYFISFLDDPAPTIEQLMRRGVLVKALRDSDEELRDDWDGSCGALARFSRDIGVRGCFDTRGVNHYAVRATSACQPLWTRIEAQGGL